MAINEISDNGVFERREREGVARSWRREMMQVDQTFIPSFCLGHISLNKSLRLKNNHSFFGALSFSKADSMKHVVRRNILNGFLLLAALTEHTALKGRCTDDDSFH